MAPMNPRLLRPIARFQAPTPGTPATLLLRFDGTFTDSSPNALTVSQFGSPAISTAIKKFGSGSGEFDGVGEYLTVPGSEVLIGTEDFTIEAWVYLNTITFDVFSTFWAHRETEQVPGGPCAAVYQGFPWFLVANADASGWALEISSLPVSVNTWHHVAMARKDGTVRGFLDGVRVASFTSSSAVGVSGSLSIMSGASDTPAQFAPGHIDDFRMVKGLAVYEFDFVPPTAALSVNASVALAAPLGTFLFSQCVGGSLTGTYADGAGGRYTEVISQGSCS
jgi:hypothetical protein